MTRITCRLQLEPKALANLERNVEHECRRRYLKKCSKTHGYILDVANVELLEAVVASSNSSIECDVAFDARCLYPRVGKLFRGVACLVFELGVLLEISGVMKVLVPHQDGHFVEGGKLVPYDFDAENHVFLSRDGSKRIAMHASHGVKICGMAFNTETKSFNCYGELS
jgi:DNA-directed RNA polymerase subunit E'/Rpb7